MQRSLLYPPKSNPLATRSSGGLILPQEEEEDPKERTNSAPDDQKRKSIECIKNRRAVPSYFG